MVHDNGGGGGGGGGGTAGPPLFRILPGASTIVSPGTQAGYGITANTGGSYRVVWTGDSNVSGQYSEFTGTIFTPGVFTDFAPGCADGSCPLEAGDAVNAPMDVAGGQQITFDTIATDGLDGVDFAVSLEPVEFDIQIDGTSYPDLVFFPDTDNGGQIATPSSIPFDLTTN
ncbi:MAG TPA: hypothetical protein VGL86_31645 [Polyangia bacterium]